MPISALHESYFINGKNMRSTSKSPFEILYLFVNGLRWSGIKRAMYTIVRLYVRHVTDCGDSFSA